MHIGDDPTSDVHRAKAAGMHAILLTGGTHAILLTGGTHAILLTGGWHGSRPHRSAEDAGALTPDAVVGDLENVPAAIAQLARSLT